MLSVYEILANCTIPIDISNLLLYLKYTKICKK